jgi:UDP-glucose 4-epimerase
VHGDLKKRSEIKKLFEDYEIDFVIHLASYSDVKESMENPTKYHENNVFGTFNLLSEMIKHNVLKIIFSSTAAVYGEAKEFPIVETAELNPINPYGVSKLMIEKMLDNFEGAYGLKSIKLRYFNVIGANFEQKIGRLLIKIFQS